MLPGDDGPRLSVILPAGRADRVGAAVASLLNQTLPRSRYEIIVVTPEPGKLTGLVDDGVRLIDAEALLPPGAMRNLGAAGAYGDILFFLDDDCLAPASWLNDMTRILLQAGNDKIGAIGCRVVAAEETFWNRAADQALFTSYQGERDGEVAGLGSAALAVRRQAFDEVGGFDGKMLASEDWDFSLKLRQGGYRCRFEPSIEVRHDHRRGEFFPILHTAFQYGFLSGLEVQRRYYPSMTWLSKIMVCCGSPWLYWLVTFPYAAAVTLLWAVETRRSVTSGLLPLVFFARCAYQAGVWRRLWRNMMNISFKKHVREL